jgi:D-alanyl-D-alanine carboxypeptidase
MLRTTLASSRVLRVSVLGLATLTSAAVFTTGTADARHYRHRAYHHSHARHHVEHESYNPAFSSIIVDANSGATLSASSPDASRHPA